MITEIEKFQKYLEHNINLRLSGGGFPDECCGAVTAIRDDAVKRAPMAWGPQRN
jgi:hypothetical protein